jgi:hypothetical protein
VPLEIIPKQRAAPKPKVSLFEILYYLTLILFLIALLSYFWLGVSYRRSEQKLEEIEAGIAEKETKGVKALEERIIRAKAKIETFASLFKQYKKNTTLFNFLKENCHKKVFFSDVEIDAEENMLKIAGKVESFKVLAEQILIFRGQDFVNSLTLKSINISKEGGIGFDIILFINPQIFK